MERRLKNKLDDHQQKFKEDLLEWIKNKQIVSAENDDCKNDFIQYLFDYENFIIQKEDFQKRKRTKNIISCMERCIANRANGEQCTRRRKEGVSFCGTHTKGTPHGVKEDIINENTVNIEKVDIWVQEIKGINYYIDAYNNVYRADHVVSNKQLPEIIAKWALTDSDKYCIPEFNI